MKKFLSTIIGLLVVTLVFAAGALYAEPAKSPLPSPDFELPSNAKQISENVYHLGTAVDKGRQVEGLAIIHPRPAEDFHHKPDHAGGPPGSGGDDDDGGDSQCYAFIANGARWRETESYIVNPSNQAGLDTTEVRNNLATSMDTWEEQVSFDIFGSENTDGSVDGIDTESTDGKNEIEFGDIDSEGAIAVTVVWYTTGGPPWAREIVEHDQMYDDVDFSWSLTGDADDMDFLNIATHEIGHSAGLGHPDDSCTEETMYAYAEEGETKKQTLHDGDVAGIKDLY